MQSQGDRELEELGTGVGAKGDRRARVVVALVALVARCFRGWRNTGGQRLERAVNRERLSEAAKVRRVHHCRGVGEILAATPTTF
jgi:hypothetical protein